MIFVTYRNIFLGIAVAVVLAAIAIIGVFGLKLGIDFTGGSLMESAYTVVPEKALLDEALAPLGLGGYSLRQTVGEGGSDGYLLQTRDLTEQERVQVEGVLTSYGEGATITRFTSIGPVIGQELKDKALWAIVAVSLLNIRVLPITP